MFMRDWTWHKIWCLISSTVAIRGIGIPYFRRTLESRNFMQDHLILHEELNRESRAGPNPALGHFSLSLPPPHRQPTHFLSFHHLLYFTSTAIKLSTHLICIYIKVNISDGQETSCEWQEGQVQQSINGSRHTTSCARPHTNQTHPRRNESVRSPSSSPLFPRVTCADF